MLHRTHQGDRAPPPLTEPALRLVRVRILEDSAQWRHAADGAGSHDRSCHRCTLQQCTHKANLENIPIAQSQRPPLDSELMRQRQAQGLPLGEIARRIGVPRSTLYDHL